MIPSWDIGVCTVTAVETDACVFRWWRRFGIKWITGREVALGLASESHVSVSTTGFQVEEEEGGADVTFGTFTLPGPATEAEGSPQSVFFFFYKPLLSRNITAQLWRTTCVCYSVYVHHSSHFGVKAAAGKSRGLDDQAGWTHPGSLSLGSTFFLSHWVLRVSSTHFASDDSSLILPVSMLIQFIKLSLCNIRLYKSKFTDCVNPSLSVDLCGFISLLGWFVDERTHEFHLFLLLYVFFFKP